MLEVCEMPTEELEFRQRSFFLSEKNTPNAAGYRSFIMAASATITPACLKSWSSYGISMDQ